ncbi:TonB-dependent receptor [Sulfurovum sp. ST-21]|uniref:TonB-dependent receptor n=1 Tax=Sulfurovum indicum TaxID=2779528 RepID=A0A7M1S6J6_9BACT|nr:TonB-dependent receptor [Sulfurovum indicum]QOR62732.1 TonB-dependent receptor [Sulfurovum indicum]
MNKQTITLSVVVLCATALFAEETTLAPITVQSSTIVDIAEDMKTEPSTVNTINEEEITKINPKNINNLLQTIPGITADVRNSAVEIHIRGISQQEFMWEDTGVAIVIDGVPVLQNGGKIKFNIDEIESIKVIKGGASYLYGNNALAGAVIITTKKAKNKTSGWISVEGGSYGYKNAETNLKYATDKYAASLNLNFLDDDSYWDQEGENWNKSVNGKLQYYIDETSDVTLGINYTDRFEAGGGSVTGVTNAELYPKGIEGDWSYIRDYYSTLQKYFLRYEKEFSNGGQFMANAYYYKDEYDYKSSPQDIDGDTIDDFYLNDNNDNIEQYGVKTEYRASLENLAYMVGLDTGQRIFDKYRVQLEDTYRGKQGDYTDSTNTEDRLAVYGEGKYAITSAWTAIANLRIDYDKYNYTSLSYSAADGVITADNDTSFTNCSYRLGTTYDFMTRHTLFANVSTGFRNPTVSQIYAGDFDPQDYVNNPNLDPETTINYEIGLRGTLLESIYYEASLFLTDTKDIIAKNGGTYYSSNADIMFDNVGDARNRGVELSLKSDRRKALSFSLAYTYLDAYYTSHTPFTVSLGNPYVRSVDPAADDVTYDINGNQLPRVPHHKLDLFVHYKIRSNLELSAEFYAQSEYYADETNLVTMPGYGKMNLFANYSPTENLEIFAKMENVFDKQYYRTVYLFSDSNYDGVLDAEDASITVDPGRLFYLGLRYRF